MFYCNLWATNSSNLQQYLIFFNSAKNICDNDENIKNVFNTNAQYAGLLQPTQLKQKIGFPYYTWHCFVFERLPCFYFHLNGICAEPL